MASLLLSARLTGRRIRRLAALTIGCLLLLPVAVSTAAPPTTTLTFDELSFQPVDGLHFGGVRFAFEVAGSPSADASYGAFGPGSITYVQAPLLEGNAAGTLTLRFDQPTTVLDFGLALSTFGSLTPGARIELFTPGGHSRGSIPLNTQELIFFTEGRFSYTGGVIGSAAITFEASAGRFALDNLTFRAPPPSHQSNPPASSRPASHW
jgi:hypothetical protein